MVKLYPHPVEPEKYPEFLRRRVKVVTRDALNHEIHFTALRTFPAETDEQFADKAADAGSHPPLKQGGRMAHVQRTIDMYVNHFKLGRVLWPVYPTLFAENFDELVEICRRDGLYLYDFWGYVPGSKPSDESIWGEYEISDEVDAMLRERLGDHFLGYDNGEQDGRYVHHRGRLACPINPCRADQYAQFQSYFEKLNDAMRNHTVTLSSLTFLPYFAKEGNTIMIGAETAQALPSSPMWFSFIRGASKQYGLLNYGNASVWNRWGYKDYLIDSREPDTSLGYEMGRFAGTSLGLLRRLMYNHYVYGCDILGFEGSWTTTRNALPDDRDSETQFTVGGVTHNLTPVGMIQKTCVEFVKKHGRPGVLHTPVALVLPFHAGWVPPRHLYTRDVYKVWGSIPYGRGDHQIHCLLTMLYPGYENAGFYRDERGFETPTPYGEIADVLLSDARLSVLTRYDTLILTSDVALDAELCEKLKTFVEDGGTLIAFAGMAVRDAQYAFKLFGLKALTSEGDGRYAAIAADGMPMSGGVYTNACGEGKTVLMLCEDGLERTNEAFTADNASNEPICQPYRFSADVHAALDNALCDVQILSVSNPALQYALAAREQGEYTLYVGNSGFAAERFDLIARAGRLLSAEELPIEDGVVGLPEFLPLLRGEPGAPCRAEGQYVIEPGNAKIFRVRLGEEGVARLPELNPVEVRRNLYVKLPASKPAMKRAMLDWPTFSHHFDGFIVSARYFEDLDLVAARSEAHYMYLQRTSVLVDFTEMLNHFPGLSLIGNIEYRDAEAMRRIERILDAVALYDVKGVIIAPHRNAENEYTEEQAVEGFARSVERIGAMCAARSLPLLVRNRPMARDMREAGFGYALDAASQLCEGQDDFAESTAALLLSCPRRDDYGQMYCMNLPIRSESEFSDVLKVWATEALRRQLPIALTADYADWNDVYQDVAHLNSL